MNFKEALIAHLQGEKVEAMGVEGEWKPLMQKIGEGYFSYIDHNVYMDLSFRLAPCTIRVNGVEVPVPESVAPVVGATYYVPDPLDERLYNDLKWRGDEIDERALANGVLYLSIDACIARAKAMLITQE